MPYWPECAVFSILDTGIHYNFAKFFQLTKNHQKRWRAVLFEEIAIHRLSLYPYNMHGYLVIIINEESCNKNFFVQVYNNKLLM